MLQGKTVLLGVSGGIAAYKSITLCSRLVQAGAIVDVIMTEGARQFVQPLSFQAISRRPVLTDTFREEQPDKIAHIDAAERADLIVIAPATANVLARLAHGLADDMLTTTVLASKAPLWVAPAMNVHMYEHAAVQDNLATLRRRGVHVIEPGSGPLACGYTGKGRLPEPEQLFSMIEAFFAEQSPIARLSPLEGKSLLVTAGGTKERIDAVRYIHNDSSGKMGFAVAEAGRDAGMDVTLVSAPVDLPTPSGVKRIDVESADDMYQAVMRLARDAHIVVKAAAVADYRPVRKEKGKIKKSGEEWTIRLERTPDILQTLGQMDPRPFLVGFAAEAGDPRQYALDKIRRKNCDLLVANDVTQDGAGFGTDTNIVQIYQASGLVESIPRMSKQRIAQRILQLAADRMTEARNRKRGEPT